MVSSSLLADLAERSAPMTPPEREAAAHRTDVGACTAWALNRGSEVSTITMGVPAPATR